MTLAGTRRIVCAALAAALASQTGCVPGPTLKLSSSVSCNGVPRANRLLVIANFRSPVIEPVLYDRFRVALSNRFGACGVAALIWRTSAAPDDAERFGNNLREFQPSAVLEIRELEDYAADRRTFSRLMIDAAGKPQAPSPGIPQSATLEAAGLLLVLGLVAPPYTRVQLSLSVTMFDAESALTIWRARADFQFATRTRFTSEGQSLASLADSLVDRLAEDGVLACRGAKAPAGTQPQAPQPKRSRGCS